MEEDLPAAQPAVSQPVKAHRQEVITVRNWKEYLGESLLIIFSVALAILLTELFTKMHERQQEKEVLDGLRQELNTNLEAETVQYAYHRGVIKRIDSALHDVAFRRQFIDNGKLHLSALAPDGIMKKDLNDVAWQVARQTNIVAKINLDTYSLLTDIYDNQQRIWKLEDEVGKLLLSFDSRKPENEVTTLMLLRDNFSGWAVDRAPSLIDKYRKAIEALKKY